MAEKRKEGASTAPLEGTEWSRDAPDMRPVTHQAPWEGAARFSESGDENADGTVSPETADYVATGGNRHRPTAAERAASFQRPVGEPAGRYLEHAGEVPEARDDYGLGRPGHLAPERRAARPGEQEREERTEGTE